MSRDDGFSIADVSTDLLAETRLRRLARYAPDHVGAGVVGYLATMLGSWRAGKRVTAEDSWPVYLMPYDQLAIDALIHVGLLDARARIPVKPWREWFQVANQRRDARRKSWHDYDLKRRNPNGNADLGTTSNPRSADALRTAPSVPSRTVPTEGSTRPFTAKAVEHGARVRGAVDPSRNAA